MDHANGLVQNCSNSIAGVTAVLHQTVRLDVHYFDCLMQDRSNCILH